MSRKKAIEDFCRQCIVDPSPGNGTWRSQTESCTSLNCSLHGYRPRSYSTPATGPSGRRSLSLAREIVEKHANTAYNEHAL